MSHMPDPEITPDEVTEVRDDAITATGRSDFQNQVNNVLGFPFIFRGALDVRARKINKLACPTSDDQIGVRRGMCRRCRRNRANPPEALSASSGCFYNTMGELCGAIAGL